MITEVKKTPFLSIKQNKIYLAENQIQTILRPFRDQSETKDRPRTGQGQAKIKKNDFKTNSDEKLLS